MNSVRCSPSGDSRGYHRFLLDGRGRILGARPGQFVRASPVPLSDAQIAFPQHKLITYGVPSLNRSDTRDFTVAHDPELLWPAGDGLRVTYIFSRHKPRKVRERWPHNAV